tara:strand:- start:2368 stop:2703 length:336 start_codon:yes stop_codon:yes gene_type:complete
MKLKKCVWILILLFSCSWAFSSHTIQTIFADNSGKIISTSKFTEGKQDLTKADLPEFFPDKKTFKFNRSSLDHLAFNPVNSYIVTEILEGKTNPILMLYNSKILFPFHSFL